MSRARRASGRPARAIGSRPWAHFHAFAPVILVMHPESIGGVMPRNPKSSRASGSMLAVALTLCLVTSTANALVIYVDDDAPANGDGLTWDTAFRFLQDAIAFANVPAN